MRTGTFREPVTAADKTTDQSPRPGNVLPSQRSNNSLTGYSPRSAISGLRTRAGSLGALNRSAEGSPGFVSSFDRKKPPAQLCKGTLYVALPALRGGAAEWQPFTFKHHRDGAVSFKNPGVQSDSTNFGGSLGSGASSSDVEYVLDADWQKPFVAAPWKPLARSRGPPPPQQASQWPARSAQSLPPSAGAAGPGTDEELYPFTLSYAPVPAKPGEADHAAPARRTMVLAAESLAARRRWLATFSRKSESPALREAASVPSLASTSTSLRAAKEQQRRLGALGERHSGVPTASQLRPVDSSRRRTQRLVAGHKGMWDKHSKFHIVRELYDGYAADPIGEVEKGGELSAASPQAASSRRLLERYVERQAKIEGLLEQQTNLGRIDLHIPAPPGSAASEAGLRSVDQYAMPGMEEASQPLDFGPSEREVAKHTPRREPEPPPIEVCGMTPNAHMDGNTLCNDQWSGGALFMPPNTHSFRFTIRPEGNMQTNPVFIGIAPADSDLSILNFFDVGGGVFLCMGGLASEALIAALGAPGGPSFHAFGERSVARLPVPPLNSTVAVHYTEEKHPNGGPPEGQVTFLVIDETDEGAYYARPALKQRLTGRGGWRPCVLLSMPNTRVKIESLV